MHHGAKLRARLKESRHRNIHVAAPCSTCKVDGSVLEGGGQILRNSLGYAARKHFRWHAGPRLLRPVSFKLCRHGPVPKWSVVAKTIEDGCESQKCFWRATKAPREGLLRSAAAQAAILGYPAARRNWGSKEWADVRATKI